MRIAIDARLNAYRRGGIPQYTRHLLTALAEVARDVQFISLQHRGMLRPLAVAPNVQRRVVLTPPHHRFEHWSLPLELLLSRIDVLHFPDFIAPVRRSFPAVVTIHDLAFMHYPHILDDAAKAYYGQIGKSSVHANAIIAVSEATRQDIAQFLDVPIEQIDVIYEAAAPMFRRLDLREGEARVLNGLPVAADSFMLFVSTLEPRKNLPTLLQALRICVDRRPDRPYRLVIAGGRGWRDEPIFAAVRDLHLADHVVFAGSVGQYDLRWLYNACRFYINPSLYEGFGLPLLEAMACGAACLASATSSLPEIGGDAAIYVPPLDPGLWADAIEELWDDQDRQQELGRLGRARAQRFSWLRAARETLKVYERAATGAPREATVVPTDVLPEPVIPAIAAPSPGQARSCLRCATMLIPGEIQHDIAIRPAGNTLEQPMLASRAWVCPNCGQVEFVSELALLDTGHSIDHSNGAVVAPAPPLDAPPLAAPEQDELPAYASQPQPDQHDAAFAPVQEALVAEPAVAARPAADAAEPAADQDEQATLDVDDLDDLAVDEALLAEPDFYSLEGLDDEPAAAESEPALAELVVAEPAEQPAPEPAAEADRAEPAEPAPELAIEPAELDEQDLPAPAHEPGGDVDQAERPPVDNRHAPGTNGAYADVHPNGDKHTTHLLAADEAEEAFEPELAVQPQASHAAPSEAIALPSKRRQNRSKRKRS